MSHRITGSSDHNIRTLSRKLWKTKRRIWKKVGNKLNGPKKNRIEANLQRISNNTSKDDVIVVPGKVLGVGELNHPLTIACLKISNAARQKVVASGSKLMTIEELLEQNPTGANVKLFY